MADSNKTTMELLNIAPGRKMQVKTVPKPVKVNPYIEPPFLGTGDAKQPDFGQPQRANAPERTQNTQEDLDFAPSFYPRRGTPERQSLRKEAPSRDVSFVQASPPHENFDDRYGGDEEEPGPEEEPQSYAIFHDDMSKIKKFKDDYNGAYEKDKELDRKLTVQKTKLDLLVEHHNELVDKKKDFKDALMEVMKENARLEQRNEELEEDIKELEDAIEKGIKMVNDDDEDDDMNLNLFMLGGQNKSIHAKGLNNLHEMKIERERRKLKRALINALNYMEGKESRLTGIKEHRTPWQRFVDK